MNLNLYGMREAAQEVSALRAECERLRGLLAIARDALEDAVHTFEALRHFVPAERMHNALERSNPDAD